MQTISSIAFFCSFGGMHGWGHAMRCCALAQAATRRGWKTQLVTPNSPATLPDEARAAYGEIWHADGPLSLPAVAASGCDAYFVDEMYASDEDFRAFRLACESQPIRRPPRILAAADDLMRRRMAAMDIVVNPALGLEKATYETQSGQLLGERYCMLRKGFHEPSSAPALAAEDEDFVFVMLGGTDPLGLSSRVLEILAGESSIVPVFVSGEKPSGEAELSTALAGFHKHYWLRSLSSAALASWLSICDYAIIGCGSSSYELAAMRVPFIGLSLIDNQSEMGRKIAAHWGLPVVHCENDHGKIQAIPRLFKNLQKSFPKGRKKAYAKVDALGCDRILDAIQQLY